MGNRNVSRKRYSVWKNRTDELVACDMTAAECAEMMGIAEDSFWRFYNLVRNGKRCKWYIEECEPMEE